MWKYYESEFFQKIVATVSIIISVICGFYADYLYLTNTDPGNLLGVVFAFVAGFTVGAILSFIFLIFLPMLLIILALAFFWGTVIRWLMETTV